MPEPETKDELLKSFHQQFAENQNHHQVVFIQFISAVFVVIIGYVFVYTNTSSDAMFFNVTRDNVTGEHIISYSISDLIGSYFLAQIILTLLCSLTMNIGYGYRRDQNVNYNIRKYYIEETIYTNIFGTKSFNPTKKRLLDFLPEFNSIFVNAILIIQVFFIISIIYALCEFDNFKFYLTDNWHCLEDSILIMLLVSPLLISLNLYGVFYRKYKKITEEKIQ